MTCASVLQITAPNHDALNESSRIRCSHWIDSNPSACSFSRLLSNLIIGIKEQRAIVAIPQPMRIRVDLFRDGIDGCTSAGSEMTLSETPRSFARFSRQPSTRIISAGSTVVIINAQITSPLPAIIPSSRKPPNSVPRAIKKTTALVSAPTHVGIVLASIPERIA